MWDYLEFAWHCVENMTPEQIVLGVTNVLLTCAGYFGLRIGKSAAMRVGSAALLLVGAVGWAFKRKEDSDAYGAATGALEDDTAMYDGALLACSGMDVTFEHNGSMEPCSVRSAVAAGVDVYKLLPGREKKRFNQAALAKAKAVIERDRVALNKAVAASIRKRATLEQATVITTAGKKVV